MVTTRNGPPGSSGAPPDQSGDNTPVPLQDQVAALTQMVSELLARDQAQSSQPDSAAQTAMAMTQMTEAVSALARAAQSPSRQDYEPVEDLFLPVEPPETPVDEIVVANTRFASLLKIESYRLANRRRSVTTRKVTVLTKRAREIRPRISKLFDGRDTLELTPFCVV
jgi:hypothetical protein